jgi:RNA polymerase sigma-70 factor (ECF subfamily)
MYEEKSTEQIAAQVGLSENATRQLIFRARAAFKKALIGDVDTTGMSAAAILSVAARKAASEGKKVGAAALTLIALVVMSFTAFPALNRAPADQMAEAPVRPGSSQESGQVSAGSGSVAEGSNSEAGTTDASAEGSNPEDSAAAQVSASPSPTQSEKEEIKEVLGSPAVGGIINSDSRSKIFAIDQTYTAIGDNGLTAKFTFNPGSDEVFSNVLVEINLDGYFFEFEPANVQLITGKNAENLDVYMLVGDATQIYDEFGKKWSKSELGKSRVVIEVVMQPNGRTVQSIKLALYSR